MKRITTLMVLGFFALSMFGQTTFFWRGEAQNGSWVGQTANGNEYHWWTDKAELPTNSEILRFNNWAQLEMTNDLDGTNRHQIWFDNGSGPRVIGGVKENTFYDYDGKIPMIENKSGETQTIAFPIKIGENNNLNINPVVGDIIIDAPVNLNNKFINIWGNNNYSLEFRKEIYGGGDIAIQENSVLKFTAPMSYTGNTWIGAGSLELYHDNNSQLITVNDHATLHIKGDVEVKKIKVHGPSKIEVAAGKSLTVTEELENWGSIILHSDEVNGTATLIVKGIQSGTGTATVEHYLTDARPSWYMSLPVSTLNGNTGVSKAYIFTEANEVEGTSDPNQMGWSETSGAVAAGQGVMLQPSSGVDKFSFTGALNNGDILVDNLTMESRRFHYLGNPYPSFINWDDMYDDSDYVGGVQDIIWFRTHNGINFYYQTYNGEVADTDEVDDGIIAPMQGFWVRAETAGAYVKFDNGLRKHAPVIEAAMSPSRASQAELQLLRLAVSQGNLTDHTVVYFKESNSNAKDRKDAAKLRNNNAIPEIWTLVEGEAVAINAMQTVPYNVEQTLGFYTSDSGEFTISASTFSAFAEGDAVELIDHAMNRVHKLTESDYSFSADAGSTTDRFSIRFVPGAATSVSQPGIDHLHVYSVNNQLQVNLGAMADNARATIYTVSGQQIGSQQLTSSTATIARNLSSGVYMVVVENGGERTVKRVILK